MKWNKTAAVLFLKSRLVAREHLGKAEKISAQKTTPVSPSPSAERFQRGRRGATDVSFYISALSPPLFLISNFLLLLLCLPPPTAASHLSPPSLFPTLCLSISHLPLSPPPPPLASFPLTTLGKCRHVFAHFKKLHGRKWRPSALHRVSLLPRGWTSRTVILFISFVA